MDDLWKNKKYNTIILLKHIPEYNTNYRKTFIRFFAHMVQTADSLGSAHS